MKGSGQLWANGARLFVRDYAKLDYDLVTGKITGMIDRTKVQSGDKKSQSWQQDMKNKLQKSLH
jgi:hypothetical protein